MRAGAGSMLSLTTLVEAMKPCSVSICGTPLTWLRSRSTLRLATSKRTLGMGADSTVAQTMKAEVK